MADKLGALPATPPAPSGKADPVDLDALKAGLAMMQPRITAEVAALGKIDVTQHSRLFMHPGDAKRASVEFDTKGLHSLELAPYIEDLRANSDCAGPQAGVVRLSWSTDGSTKPELMVDRSYTGTVAVDLAKSSRLELDVDKGNETTLCDWFSVGFLNVK
jgi:hypothetical protein